MENYIKYQGVRYYHGDSVTCIIDGNEINDAKISITEYYIYICQNVIEGMNIICKFEYRFSWELDHHVENLKKVSNKLTNNAMTLKEKFVLTLTKEPQKSFRKAGITDGDDMLTEEGQKIFLSWLLREKYANDFKEEVVDNILKESEKE